MRSIITIHCCFFTLFPLTYIFFSISSHTGISVGSFSFSCIIYVFWLQKFVYQSCGKFNNWNGYVLQPLPNASILAWLSVQQIVQWICGLWVPTVICFFSFHPSVLSIWCFTSCHIKKLNERSSLELESIMCLSSKLCFWHPGSCLFSHLTYTFYLSEHCSFCFNTGMSYIETHKYEIFCKLGVSLFSS